MKFIIYLVLITGSLFAQDSLFWFDMNTVRDPLPKTPKVLDKIFGTSQLGVLDSLKNAHISTKDGFRLQMVETSLVDEANLNLRKFREALSDSVYMIFEAPFYKIRYGNFVTKKEAEIEKLKLNREGYQDIWIVRSRIEQINYPSE